jgi:copper chaperone NosL
MTLRAILVLLLVAGFAGCKKPGAKAEAPAAQSITASAIGEFCGMALTEHAGPKGQIFIGDQAKPFWFASVRDAVAFTLLPEMPKNLTAFYVTDMTDADWDRPDGARWIEARQARFVIGSNERGGMNVDEAVPFATQEAAGRFAQAHGGNVVTLDAIPHRYVLSAGDGS